MAKFITPRHLRFAHRVFQAKQFVFIVSSMRSGSTLLKSLLANASDVSHLPEVPFHRFRWYNKWMLKTLSDKPIMVLKKPAWAFEKNYPTIPRFRDNKIIVLFREPAATVQSLHHSYKDKQEDFEQNWPYEKILLQYWMPAYQGIRQRKLLAKDNVKLVRYEDLLADPIEITRALFRFIGSAETRGFDTYQPKDDYYWEWGKDDGSEKIKSLKVQPEQKIIDPKILKVVNENMTRLKPILDYYGVS